MDKTPDSLSHIFIKYLEGDEDAFSYFYKFFIGDLYSYGRSLGADDSNVMDAVQDVFIKVYHERPNLKSVEHFKYFLLRSLKNRLYDLFKSKSFSTTDDIDENAMSFSVKTTVLDEIIEEEDRIIIEEKIERLLSVLSPLQKEALYLRYMQSLEYSEISEMMDRSEVSIRKLVSQAIIKIRRENDVLPMLAFIALLFG